MFYDPRIKKSHGLPHDPFKACVAPRPIGWITSLDAKGGVNLSPFSFFNAINDDPPMVCFSGGTHPDGRRKDSVTNVLATREFVCNLATWKLRRHMNVTSYILEEGVDELSAAGLTPVPAQVVRPPRVAETPVHIECLLWRSIVLPETKPGFPHVLVIGEVVGIHIDDAYINADGLVDTLRLRPVARLGYRDYTSIESVFSMGKMTPADLAVAEEEQAAE